MRMTVVEVWAYGSRVNGAAIVCLFIQPTVVQIYTTEDYSTGRRPKKLVLSGVLK